MFAGRYLWWGMVAIAGFLFFAVYFDYVSWAIVQCSGCAKAAGSCGPLVNFLQGTVKPGGFWLAGGILLVCTIARIHYLKLNPLWDLVVVIWFVATGPFPMLFADIWHGGLNFQAILDALPIPPLFLVAFGAYLVLPFEDGERTPLGTSPALHVLIGLVVLHSVLMASADNVVLPLFLSRELGLTLLAATVAAIQPNATYLLHFGRSDDTASYVGLAVFILCLLVTLLPERWIEVVTGPPALTPTESRRRRSGRA